MKKIRKKLCLFLLVLATMTGSIVLPADMGTTVTVEAATKMKLNKKKLTLETGDVSKLKLTMTVQNVTYTVTTKNITWKSSNKKVASVSKKGKVTAKKAGKATITAKVGKKKYTCKVTVKAKSVSAAEVTAQKEKEDVLALINEARAEQGLDPLEMDDTLNAAADARAKELTESFSHTRPDGSSCFTVLQEDTYQTFYGCAGENIAAGYSNAASVMDGWMNSAGHRANILGASYTKVGIGYYYDSSQPFGYYWVQIFIG